MRFGPSPCMRRPMPLTLRTMSVTSSSTPGIDENSCSTPSICIEVTAAPCSDDSSTRRSALPSVRPKPRSSGSATTVATRVGIVARLDRELLRLDQSLPISSASRARPQSFERDGIAAALDTPARDQSASSSYAGLGAGAGGAGASDPAPLGRAAAVMRDRRHVADRGDREARPPATRAAPTRGPSPGP